MYFWSLKCYSDEMAKSLTAEGSSEKYIKIVVVCVVFSLKVLDIRTEGLRFNPWLDHEDCSLDKACFCYCPSSPSDGLANSSDIRNTQFRPQKPEISTSYTGQ